MPGHGVVVPVEDGAVRRRAWLAPAFERLDDDHASAAAWAWRAEVVGFVRRVGGDGWRDPEQLAGVFEMGLAGGAGEQAVVADAVEAAAAGRGAGSGG